jgi:hypothetical protein
LKRRGFAPLFAASLALAGVLASCSNDNTGQSPLASAHLTNIAVIDSSTRVNFGFPLVFDPAGEPHVAYMRLDAQAPSWAYARQILHAHRVNGTWQHEIAVINGDFLDGLNLGIAPNDEPFVVYQRILGPCSGRLEIESRAPNGYWSEAVIDSDGYPGWDTSMQVLPSGDIRLAYAAGCPYYDLRYAERIGGVWSVTTVESEGSTGYSPSLASTPDGEPLIVSFRIYDETAHIYPGIHVAERIGGTWKNSMLALDGLNPRLATDRAGRIHMIYCESITPSPVLKHALRLPSGSWQHELIANEWFSEGSVAFDAQENIWFAYASYPALRLGAGSGDSWFLKDAPEAGSVTAVTMAATPDGRLAVAYITSSNKLYFAWIQI